jgi:catechol 2,3-dioxygenase-like lactoylglutathione lyase family enzyme
VSADAPDAMRCTQVALSVLDRERAADWYTRGLGYLPAGGMEPDNHEEIAALQGLPESEPRMGWVVDSQDFFQLEFFQFKRPQMRERPAGWRPCDIGYSMVSFHVDDLDATLEQLRAIGTEPLTAPRDSGGGRRVCVLDPDGVLVELMEADPRAPGAGPRVRPEVPVVVRSLTASVPDLERSRKFFVDTLGMVPASTSLHLPEDEALWGLEGAHREEQVLWSGDFAIELVHYTDPVGKPWPEGYKISDQGILNLALGTRSREIFRSTLAAVEAAGYQANTALGFPFAEVDYVIDDQGFSAELFFLEASADEIMGFLPLAGAGQGG